MMSRWALCLLLPSIECILASASTSTLLQATWLPVSYHTATMEDVDASLNSLSKHGVQRVYVDVWNQGVLYYQSPTMLKFINNQSCCVGRDILAWALKLAPKYDMEVVAWFEYGLMAAYASVSSNQFALEAQSRGWLLGQYNNYYWMNASMMDVQEWFISVLHDALDLYVPLGLRGIQLDDHFGYPVSLGGSTTVMNSFMHRVHTMVELFRVRHRNTLLLSLSPSILSMSLGTYSVDWDLWGEHKLYDEVIPQLYRSDINSYTSIFQETIASISATTKSLFTASGIRVDGSGSSTPESDVSEMMQYTNDYGIGNCIWYARGILETYPNAFPMEW